MPVHEPGMPEPRGLQLWVDLPKEVSGSYKRERGAVAHDEISIKWWNLAIKSSMPHSAFEYYVVDTED